MKRVVLGLVFVLIGGGVLAWSSRTTSRISASREWPTARGAVLSSVVEVDSSRIRGGGYNILYRADVRYRFAVNGESFESNVFVFGVPKSFANRVEAERIVAAHPGGSGVEVYYEPGNPVRSCLEPGAVPQEFGMLALMSGAFLLTGLMLLVSGALAWARSGVLGR